MVLRTVYLHTYNWSQTLHELSGDGDIRLGELSSRLHSNLLIGVFRQSILKKETSYVLASTCLVSQPHTRVTDAF